MAVQEAAAGGALDVTASVSEADAAEPGSYGEEDALCPFTFELEVSQLEAVEVDMDWREYQWPSGTRRWRRWTPSSRAEVHVPVLESALCDAVLGCSIWKSASVLADYMVEHADSLFTGDDAILDIGCGCGLLGAVATVVARVPPKVVTLSEFYPYLCCVARTTLLAALAARRRAGDGEDALLSDASSVHLDTLLFDWNTPRSSWGGAEHSYTLLLASDANSETMHHEWGLANAFDHYALRHGAVVVDANPDTRTGLAAFRDAMVQEFGFTLEPALERRISDEPRVPGIACGAEVIVVDVYRR